MKLLTICVFLGVALGRETQEAPPPLESRLVRELYLGGPPGTLVEYFRLDEPGADAKAPPLGLVRWITGPDPETERGWRTEVEVTFLEEGTRVLHTERVRPRGRKLVWRELREQAGRTVVFVWDPEGGARCVETVGGDLYRKELVPGPQAYLPLSLVERVRGGAKPAREASFFQPLANAMEALAITVTPAPPDERVLELRREEGSLAGRYRFRGKELVSFAWQEGGALATRIPRWRYRALLPTRTAPLATEEPPEQAEEGS